MGDVSQSEPHVSILFRQQHATAKCSDTGRLEYPSFILYLAIGMSLKHFRSPLTPAVWCESPQERQTSLQLTAYNNNKNNIFNVLPRMLLSPW